MSTDLSNIIMNPIRMRIIQFLMTNETSTAGDILKQMSDIPKTTLYRHLNILEENSLIVVVMENKIRGTLEKVYSLNMNTIDKGNSIENGKRNALGFLMNLYSDFDKYFDSKSVNPKKDNVFLHSATLLMTDDEFQSFFEEVNNIFKKYMNATPSEDRKIRKLSTISSPTINKK